MGHVTYIANKLLEAGMQSEQMRTYLDAHTPWQVHTVMTGCWPVPCRCDLPKQSSQGEQWDAQLAHTSSSHVSHTHKICCPWEANHDGMAQEYVDEILKPRNGVENVMKWACGRPLASDLTGIDSLSVQANRQNKVAIWRNHMSDCRDAEGMLQAGGIYMTKTRVIVRIRASPS